MRATRCPTCQSFLEPLEEDRPDRRRCPSCGRHFIVGDVLEEYDPEPERAPSRRRRFEVEEPADEEPMDPEEARRERKRKEDRSAHNRRLLTLALVMFGVLTIISVVLFPFEGKDLFDPLGSPFMWSFYVIPPIVGITVAIVDGVYKRRKRQEEEEEDRAGDARKELHRYDVPPRREDEDRPPPPRGSDRPDDSPGGRYS